jgi:signal transduction histidine kinase
MVSEYRALRASVVRQ